MLESPITGIEASLIINVLEYGKTMDPSVKSLIVNKLRDFVKEDNKRLEEKLADLEE